MLTPNEKRAGSYARYVQVAIRPETHSLIKRLTERLNMSLVDLVHALVSDEAKAHGLKVKP
jgi:hypothetical protein